MGQLTEKILLFLLFVYKLYQMTIFHFVFLCTAAGAILALDPGVLVTDTGVQDSKCECQNIICIIVPGCLLL